MLKQGNGASLPGDFATLGKTSQLRVGIASNFTADSDVTAASTRALDTVAGLGCAMKETVVPFAGPGTDIRHIERDRKGISRQLFGDVDVLLLPTTTTAVLRTNAASSPQPLSSANTVFANYYGLPAISVPSGFDSNEGCRWVCKSLRGRQRISMS